MSFDRVGMRELEQPMNVPPRKYPPSPSTTYYSRAIVKSVLEVEVWGLAMGQADQAWDN